MKQPIWSIEDVIDLEYFLDRDERETDAADRADLVERDRAIFLDKILPLERQEGGVAPQRLIRWWLQERRKSEKRADANYKTALPGEAFIDIYRLMGWGFLIAGILSGSGLAFSLLNYSGTEPLNVSVYLAALVLSQCVALLVLLIVRGIRKMKRSPFRGSVVFAVVSGVMTRLIVRIKEGALRGMKGSQREGLGAVAGLIRGKRRVYGSLFYWPVFILCQIFGIGFNVGALAATLLKVVGSDIAFGWQSTVQFSDQAVFRMVQIIALPWSWWVPAEIAHPSLSEIAGSHMILKDGIYHLATQDLVSWWPFLCLAVLTYGLTPRVILLTAGLVSERRALSRLTLDHAACARLVHRLTGPVLTTQALGVENLEGRTERIGPEHSPEAACLARKGPVSPKGVIALIPDDIFETLNVPKLQSAVYKTLGCAVQKKMRVGQDVEDDARVIEELRELRERGRLEGLLLLQEAWQPPIRESIRFIQALRSAAGDRTMIYVGLVGRPRQGAVFTRPAERDAAAWQQKLKSLGDPYLGVEELAANDR